MHLQAHRRRFREFGTNSKTYQNPPSSKPWVEPRLFGQNQSISNPSKFIRNLNQHSRKLLEIHLRAHWMLFRVFGTIPETYPNPPSSKPQAFWSKSADFEPFQIHPKSSPTFSTVVGNPFPSTFDGFQCVWNDSETYPNPPCSKAWAIAQAFWSKSANFGRFGIHPKSSPTFSKVVGNPFASTLDAFQDVCNDSRNLPKSAMFKTMGYSPGFWSKSANFGPFGIHPKSSKTFWKVLGNAFAST